MPSSHTRAARRRGWTTGQLVGSCIGSFALGAIGLYLAGFHWVGQWQTGTAVHKQLAAAVCVQKFLLQPDRGVIYTELSNTLSPYQRSELIRAHNWTHDREVAALCDDRILQMDPAYFEIPETASAELRQTG